MKKTLLALVCIMMLILSSGCSSSPKGTELTLENYTEYLKIDTDYAVKVYGSNKTYYMVDKIIFNVSSTDPKYKFNDVTITIKNWNGTYDYYSISVGKIYYNTEIGYNGGSVKIELPSSGNAVGIGENVGQTTGIRGFINGKITKYEVVSITGTVSE